MLEKLSGDGRNWPGGMDTRRNLSALAFIFQGEHLLISVPCEHTFWLRAKSPFSKIYRCHNTNVYYTNAMYRCGILKDGSSQWEQSNLDLETLSMENHGFIQTNRSHSATDVVTDVPPTVFKWPLKQPFLIIQFTSFLSSSLLGVNSNI